MDVRPREALSIALIQLSNLASVTKHYCLCAPSTCADWFGLKHGRIPISSTGGLRPYIYLQTPFSLMPKTYNI